jgi:hypothetical protein
VPFLREARGQLDPLGDLRAGVSEVDQPQSLVVQVGVHVALLGQVVGDPLGTPTRPGVAGEDGVGVGTEQLDRLVEVPGPDPRIADQRPAQGEQVVLGVAGVLGDEQRAPVRKKEVHLRRGLGSGRELEDEADAVDRLLLARLRHVDRRVDHAHRADRCRIAQARGHPAARAGLEQRAEHVARAPAHRDPGVDILAHGVLGEAHRGQHRHPARLDVLVGDHPAGAAEVIDVRVAVEQPRDRPVAAVVAVERQRRGGGLAGDQRVDHDHTLLALNERHVGDVVSAHLVDAGDDLEQAVDREELGLAPECRIHGRRPLSGYRGAERLQLPDDLPRVVLDPQRLVGSEEPTARVLEVVVRRGHAALNLRFRTVRDASSSSQSSASSA